jgi:hypothetical protein
MFVLQGFVHLLTHHMESWLTVARTVCHVDMVDRLTNCTHTLRLMAGALRSNDVSTAHVDVVFGTSAEMNSHMQSFIECNNSQSLQMAWSTLKQTIVLVTRHLKVIIQLSIAAIGFLLSSDTNHTILVALQVRSNLQSVLIESALQRGWQIHANQMDAVSNSVAAEAQGEGLVMDD